MVLNVKYKVYIESYPSQYILYSEHLPISIPHSVYTLYNILPVLKVTFFAKHILFLSWRGEYEYITV